MKDGQMTSIIVHNLLTNQRSIKPIFNQSQMITMHYEEYCPPNYNIDIKERVRSRSFYDDKKRYSQQRRKLSKYRRLNQQIETEDKSSSQPKIIDLEFLSNGGPKKKQSQKSVLSTHDYCSIMLDSMHQYIKKVQKDKKKKLQKCEKIKNFGVNIQAIKAKPQPYKMIETIERKRTIQQKPTPNIFNQLSLSDIGLTNNDSITEENNSKSFCKTISTTKYSNSTHKSKILSRKVMFKTEKKDDDQKISSKMTRMFNNYYIILSSYGVCLDRSQQRSTIDPDIKTRKLDKKFTYYVGKGNNKNLLVSIFKKRWWWTEAQDMTSANFVWSQLKISTVLQKQPSMMFSNLQEAQPHLYQKDVMKIECPLDQAKQIRNLFHKNHSSMFYYKLSQKNQKKYLRKMKIPVIVHNHYQANYMLGNKKALFYNMTEYKQYKKQDVFQYMPLTFHVQKINSKAFKNFEKKAKQEKKSLWIVKPGENSNRGQGIFVSDSIEAIKNKVDKNKKHTFIIQKYVKNILTFQRRKFDIRTYLLMVSVGGVKKFYWYTQGYLRTSSQIYNFSDLDDPFVHLTNDAIQANGDNYGKFEKGNKVTYHQFQRYLDLNYPNEKYSVQNLVEKMKVIAKEVVEATYFKIDPCKKQCSFELFGMDFLIDTNFNPWLLEVNTNPCLELSSPVLQRLIPRMIENLFRIVVDPIFQPMENQIPRNLACYIPDNIIQNNRFELIFDSLFDRNFQWEEYSIHHNSNKVYEDQNEQFEDDGQIIKIQD